MRKSNKILDIEKEYGMDYKNLLEKLYFQDKMSMPQIAKKLNCDRSNLSRQFKKLGIQARKKEEAFSNWWENSSEEDKKAFTNNSREMASTVLQSEESRNKLRQIMQTKEYKRKMSKANSGKNNGRYKPELTESHRVSKRGLFGYKQWSLAVRERDNFTCQVCGTHTKESGKLHAHHLESYHTHPELRLELSNGVTLCNTCHNTFHNKHRYQKTTKRQFIEFQKERHL